jgi:hypothetical protein
MIRNSAKVVVDRTLVNLIAYVQRRLPPAPRLPEDQPLVVAEILRRAIMESADYAEANMANALCFGNIHHLWRHAFSRRQIPGLIVEFGVWKARSTNFFAGITDETIYGFDSFEGLQEDWAGWAHPKEAFSLSGNLPQVAPNVRLVKGWFDQTLAGFLSENSGPFSFLHIDCDTYEATTTVLNLAEDRIVPGTVILFDEYFGYRGWKLGEFKAWQEFVARRDIQYDYSAFGDLAVVVTVRRTTSRNDAIHLVSN